MTRYILKPAVSMYDCNYCSKEFKSGSSLASHRYRYHKDQSLRSSSKNNVNEGKKSEYIQDESSNEDSSNEMSDATEYSFRNLDETERSKPIKSKLKSKKRHRKYENRMSSNSTEDSFEKQPAKRIKRDIINSIKPLQRSRPIIRKTKSKISKKYESSDNITSSDEDYEDSSDQAANSDQDVSINAACKKHNLCNFNESDEKCFGLLEAYNARYNYFTHFDDFPWETPEEMPVDDEKLLIDAVMSTESLADICSLLNENTSIVQKLCNRVKKNM